MRSSDSIINSGKTAEQVYLEAAQKRKKRFAGRITILIIIEVLLAAGFFFYNFRYDFTGRLLRVLSGAATGQVRVQKGFYSGDTDFGHFDGEGVFQYSTGEVYSGSWKDNKIHGQGTLQIPGEGQYTGEFQNGVKQGRGIFSWEDGSVYDGEWKNDQMDGEGEYRSSEGSIWKGIFKANQLYQGSCSFENETGSYSLEYSDGKIEHATISFADGTVYDGTCGLQAIEGTGSMRFPNEDQYTGSFENGKREKTGTYIWANGDSYEGTWENDTMNGDGTYIFSNGSVLKGTFDHNRFTDGTYRVENDYGEYTFTVARGTPTRAAITLTDGSTYDGGMDANGFRGEAQIRYSNGDQYSGNMLFGKKAGQGKYIWANGASYDGAWAEDKMDGRGTYIYPDYEVGYKLVGSFSNGYPNGDCDYYVDQNTHYQTTWSEGVCVKVSE